MKSATTLDLIVALANPSNRASAAPALAGRLGVEELLLFVRDPDLGVLIPAPGLAQTLRGGRTWRSFISACSRTERCVGEVELPEGARRAAVAFTHGNAALVLLGGSPLQAEIQILQSLLPMLAALLGAEQAVVVARAQATDAKDTVNRSQALAAALELARADASRLIAELRVQERHKDQFLAMLGHELRNPLSALANVIELLRRPSVDGERLPRLLELMARQMGQLTRLVNDLLDVSRVSRGRIELHRENILIADVLNYALEENRPLLVDRKHTATVQLSEPLAVYGDRVRLRQVFGNLINNAAKYTAPGGSIILTASKEAEHVVVRVQDNGRGISADMLPRIFELFAQAPASIDQALGGLGIGLTLVRTLVELHQGRIAAQSAGIGHGTTVCVWLPLAVHDHIAGTSPSTQSDVAQPRLSVLVVDDDKDAADSIAELLRSLGQCVGVAYDGRQALELARERDFALILLDLGMPGMDGYEVARQLRSYRQGSVCIVALTGFGADSGLARSREAQFDERLVKPVSLDALQGVLARTLCFSSASTAKAERQ